MHPYIQSRFYTYFRLTFSILLYCVQDARWRRGEAVSLKAARDSMVSLEVAAHSQLAMRPANTLP